MTLKGIEEPEQLYEVIAAAVEGRRFPIIQNENHNSTAFSVTGTKPSSMTDNSSHALMFNEKIGRVVSYVESHKWTVAWDSLVIHENIGSGSFGEVYRATWRGSNVAVKKLLQQRLSEATLLDFYAEVTLLADLRHPNICTFMGACTASPNVAIVTEYFPRGSLHRLLTESSKGGAKVTWKSKVAIAKGCCSAMAYLHSATPPILHRDLKSMNILIGEGDKASIWYFSLS